MGLDEFLIPREPSPVRPSLTSQGLDDWLVAPPAVPEPAPEARDATVAPLSGATPPPAAPRQALEGVDASRPPVVEVDAAADVPLIVPPSIDEPGPTTATAPAGSASPEPPPPAAPSVPKAAEATLADPSRLDGYLATAPLDEPAAIAWPRELVEDEAVLAPSSLVPPRLPDAAPEEGSRRPAEGRWGGSLDAFAGVGRVGPVREASPIDSRGPVAGGSAVEVDAAADDAFERIEGRLAQVAERLERAAERLASPPASIGSRPRTFRGRIDD